MVASVSAIEEAAASKTPAAVRTMPSIRCRGASGRSTLIASDSPLDAPRSGAPSAFAKAETDATRRSGIISRPALIVSSRAGRDVGGDVGELGGIGVDRRLAHDQRPEGRRQAEDVAAGGDHAAGEDLGRHEARSADPDRPVVLLAELARHAEVHEHDAFLAEDQVLGLHVPVHDLLLVHVLERLAGLAGVLDRVAERQAGLALPLEQVAEVDALDQVHHHVLAGLVLEVVEHPHDARVPKRRQQPRLDLEARGVAQVGQPLERHLRAAVGLAGAEDGAHGAARDRADDLVAPAHHGSGRELDSR